uniref:Uncharacterized protein n=1 Tax=Pyrococcus abyssi (strain GE5 / Orsay) TaxID=272844 RepID=G8ZJN9_PYRAB|nr:TPA: hypothetical protein PAB1650.1n [Pyrococcus abyssi GE5]
MSPGKTLNFTVIIKNTSELNDLYIIKPLIVYKVGNETHVEPMEPFYYATPP